MFAVGRSQRMPARIALVGVMVTGLTTLGLSAATPAFAADPIAWVLVSDAASLQSALDLQINDIELANDITVSADSLTGTTAARINLDGHTLTTHNVSIPLKLELVSEDSSANPVPGGTLSATSNTSGLAGISNSGNGQFDATGVTVVATGAAGGAGIGGDTGHSGGYVDIESSTVTATGGSNAAGIGGGDGGGFGSGGGPVALLNDSDITATAGSHSAAIGGGNGGDVGAPIYINSPGKSLSLAAADASVIGPGAGGVFLSGAAISINSNWLLDAPNYFDIPDGQTFSFGTNGGPVATLSGTGSLTGTGTLFNFGAIRLAEANLATVHVGVNNFTVTFNGESTAVPPTQTVHVYAPTLASGGVTSLPPASVLKGSVFLGWKLGSDFSTPATIYDDIQSNGGNFWATYQGVVSLGVTPLTGTIYSGSTQSIEMTGTDGSGDVGDQSPFAHLVSDGEGDVVSGDTITFGKAGTRTVSASLPGYSLSAAMTVTVTAAQLSVLTVTPSSTSVTAGGSVSFGVTGADVAGNSYGDVTADTTLTSSDGTDVIDNTTHTIGFTTAGSHTITATDGTVTRTQQIQVNNAALASLTATAVTTATAGDVVNYSVTGADAYGNSYGDVTASTTLTSDVSSDVINNVTHSIVMDAATVHTVTLTDGAITTTHQVTVSKGAVAHLSAIPTATAVVAGGSATFAVTGADAYSNSFGDVTGNVTLTSNVASDVINNVSHSIVFTAAGTHTITATDGLASVAVAIVVTAAPFNHISLVPGSLTAFVHHSRTYTLQRQDAFGNSLGLVTSGARLRSNSTSDSISGLKITFGSTGTHTLTATGAGKTTHLAVVVSRDVAHLSFSIPSVVHAGRSTIITVSLSAGPSGSKPTGTVRVYYTSRSYVNVAYSSTSHTSKTVTVPALKKGTYSLYARYLGSSNYSAISTAHVSRVFA
jgi:hypothetical protein